MRREENFSFRKHEIEGGPLGNEDVFAQGIRIFLSTLEF
jgi:hypothetical protein